MCHCVHVRCGHETDLNKNFSHSLERVKNKNKNPAFAASVFRCTIQLIKASGNNSLGTSVSR